MHVINRLLLSLTLLLCLPVQANTPDAPTKVTPKPFTATYKADYHGLTITATRTLRHLSNGLVELRFSAKSWLATIDEFSRFRWQDEGPLQPQRYEYHREGLGRDRHAVLTFQWDNNTVVNNVQDKPWRMKLPDDALDKLSYQLQLRADMLNNTPDLAYTIADGGRLKHYRFEVMGEEAIKTSVGRINAIKIKRVRADDKKRVTYLWLAKDWDYLLVRLQQRETDGERYEINLAEARVNGQPVTGK